ncbi:FMN-binding negative transcriptional regulator [Marinomonas spartinae]|uniref:FMN-binding negative transcriptional regulator n=1 Tax=Marinomonas spartinae TaxID=1792290 RepID=UPI0018F116BB|nr:FMN-binding negative transcriptional regulator [Marinomonas spartinae]MBJ7555521.1 FMN-binding negative transcriptional regulator [Marinomonas spartinae]
MYIPKNMEMVDEKSIFDFISEFGFALLVSSTLDATHLPLIYKASQHSKGCLYGHFAKANAQWEALEQQRVLAVFSGPHSYISPTWYATQPAVPTWNYASVHCYGSVELLSDRDTAIFMDELVSKYEPELHNNNELMPLAFKQTLSQAIVGFRIVIDDIQAKDKLGQHRKQDDQIGVYRALSESTHGDSLALASYMNKRHLGTGE